MLPTGKSHPAKGFTLLELLLVLAIVAMVSALIVPGIRDSSSQSLQKQVREAMSALNFARRKAVIDGVPVATTFRPGLSAGQQREPQDWVSEGALIQRTNSHGERKATSKLAVVFFPEGGSTGGTLEISQGELRSKIHIDPITGKINLLENGIN